MFCLDENNEPYLKLADKSKGKITVSNSLEKGYIYASFFFYDKVMDELKKLDTMIRKVMDEIRMEVHFEENKNMLMELSARVRYTIGNNALDAFIKEILAEDGFALSLTPADYELKKFNEIKEAIWSELFENFVNMTFRNATDVGGYKTFKFTEEYVKELTDRQRKLLAPALRMAGFINQIRLEEFQLLPDFSARYKPIPVREKFDAKEEEIKMNLKRLMEKYL